MGLAVMAAVVYLWLRAVAGSRRAPAIDRAKSHSFWCALIAFFICTSGLNEHFWDIQSGNSTPNPVGVWIIALGPAAWMAAVYLIGLFSWPRELKKVRSASLEPRSLSTPVPRYLLGFVTLIALLACSGLFFVYGQTGFAPTASIEIVTPDYTSVTDAQNGAMPGTTAVYYFAGAIASVAAAAALVSLAILRRPPLTGLNLHDNQALRAVWLNRILRMSGYLMAQIIADMAQYAAAPIFENSSADDILQVSNIMIFGIGLTLFFWGPKAQFEAETRGVPYPAFGRARDFLLAVVFIASTAIVMICAMTDALWDGTLFSSSRVSSVIGEDAGSSYLVLMGAALAYLVIICGFAFYAHLGAGASRAMPRVSKRLPIYTYIVAAGISLWGIYLMIAPPHPPGTIVLKASASNTIMIVAVIVIASLATIWWARHSAVPWKINEEEEIWYRRVMELRILRTSSAVLLAMPCVAYGLGAIPAAVALIIFSVPAAVVMESPKVSLRYWQSA